MSSKWPLSLRSPHQNLVCTFLSPVPTSCPVHLILLGLITRIIFRGEYRSYRLYRSYSSSLCSLLHSADTSSFLGRNILLSTRFSNTLGLCFSLSVMDQVSHPYRTTGKVTFLHISMSGCVDNRQNSDAGRRKCHSEVLNSRNVRAQRISHHFT